MSTVAVPQTFEEKMMNRIRDSVGELMSEDDLKKIIERGVEKALFSGRTEAYGYGNTRQIPCLVDEAVTRFLKERMEVAVDGWIKANPDSMQKAVDRAVKDGIASCVASSLDNKFTWLFQSMISTAKSQGLL